MEFNKFGEGDPRVLEAMQFTSDLIKNVLEVIAERWQSNEIAVAILAHSVGGNIGALSVAYEKHCYECDACAKLQIPWRELFLKNFNQGYAQGREEFEQQCADGASRADDMLAEILKGHDNGKLQPD